MSLQLNIFILLFGALQGVLLSIFLVRKKAYLNAYIFLAVYLGVMVLQIVLKVMSKAWLMENLRWLYSLSYDFPLLYGPLVFLLTIHLLNPKRKTSVIELLHFVPFVLIAANHFTIVAGRLGIVPHIISIVVYHLFSLYMLYEDQRHLKGYYSNTERKQIFWLRRFIVASFFVCVAVTAAIYLMFIHYPALQPAKWGFIPLTLFVYWVSFVAINQPEMFDLLHEPRQAILSATATSTLTLLRPLRKYENSNLKESEYKRIVATLQQLVELKKPQLDPEITIDGLAKVLECTRHHLSQVLNEHHHQTFYDFINALRVKEAIQLLQNQNLNQKMTAVAFDSGFNSISTFNEVFKKITGKTPSQYRSQFVSGGIQQTG